MLLFILGVVLYVKKVFKAIEMWVTILGPFSINEYTLFENL